MNVEEVKQKYHDVLKNKKLEYVLVTKVPQGLHTMYVDTYDPSRKIVNCFNSHKNDPKPKVAVKDVKNLYLVNCSAVESGNGTVFLAPIGAQEMLMFVRPFVRLFVRSCQVCLEQSIFVILAQIFKQSVRSQSSVSQQSVSNQSAVSQQLVSSKSAVSQLSVILLVISQSVSSQSAISQQ